MTPVLSEQARGGMTWTSVVLASGILLGPVRLQGAQSVNGRESLVFEGAVARLVVDVAGGAIGEFRFKDLELNPLRWATPEPGNTAVRGFGHFLCLDRWGPPSAAEGARGMPYHGEASNVLWEEQSAPAPRDGVVEGRMAARLPLAGLSVRRTIRLSAGEGIAYVEESITNANPFGRIFNMVQHPTVGPPFLDGTTMVDCNGRRGFAQGGSMPQPEEPSSFWPRAFNRSGEAVNLRHLLGDPDPNVVSYTLDGEYGWVTAATPAKGLMIGYVWRTRDYPWVSLWRDVREGQPAARGLEFGTTGLHQPYSVLVRKGRIWERALFEFLDAGEQVTKAYSMFLVRIPADFAGVETVIVEQDRLTVRERSGRKVREWVLAARGLLPR